MIIAVRSVVLTSLFLALLAINSRAEQAESVNSNPSRADATSDAANSSRPQIIRITASVDGSGRIVFTKGKAVYEHKHWGRPKHVRFEGTVWDDLSQTPAAWAECSPQLDLTKAWIVKRSGRDVITLELTPEGFDLYLCDCPQGAGDYEAVIVIPKRQ